MIVYKLTCKTGRIYYGSSTLTLKERAYKGWYKCKCKDFDIEKMEVVEEVEGNNKQLLLERESYYIENFECVNYQTAKATTEHSTKLRKIWYEKNKDKCLANSFKSKKKIKEEKRHHCSLCNLTFYSNKKLLRHTNGSRHKLKYECFSDLGINWKEGYQNWKERRQYRNKKKLNA